MSNKTIIIAKGEVQKFCVVDADLRVAPDTHGVIMARITGDERFRERDMQRVALIDLLETGVTVDMGGISRSGDQTILVSGNSAGMNYPLAADFERVRPLTMTLFKRRYSKEEFFNGGL